MACLRDPLSTCYLYQGEDFDFLQGARLREQTGKKLGHYTGGKTVRRIRVGTGIFHRGQSCQKNQDGDWEIIQGGKLREESG